MEYDDKVHEFPIIPVCTNVSYNFGRLFEGKHLSQFVFRKKKKFHQWKIVDITTSTGTVQELQVEYSGTVFGWEQTLTRLSMMMRMAGRRRTRLTGWGVSDRTVRDSTGGTNTTPTSNSLNNNKHQCDHATRKEEL